jgi:hypothetical protein
MMFLTLSYLWIKAQNQNMKLLITLQNYGIEAGKIFWIT